MESNESCSEEQLVQHKEKDLQTLLKIKEYTQEILEQLKLRIKTYDKYEKILTDSVETISLWRQVSHSSNHIRTGKEYVRLPLDDST